jgi:hypothetical protein
MVLSSLTLFKELIWDLLNRLLRAWFPIFVAITFSCLLPWISLYRDQVNQYIIQYAYNFYTLDKIIPGFSSFLPSSILIQLRGLLPLFLAYASVVGLSTTVFVCTLMLIELPASSIFSTLLIIFILFLIPLGMVSLLLLDVHVIYGNNYLSGKQLLLQLSAIFGIVSIALCVLVYKNVSLISNWIKNSANQNYSLLVCVVIFLSSVFITSSPERLHTWFDIKIDHISVIRSIGPFAIICLFLSCITFIGSFVVALGRRWHIHLLLVLTIALVVVSSLFSQDSHPVRRPFPPTSPPVGLTLHSSPKDAELWDKFETWKALRLDRNGERSGDPIFIVSAEGGGIRAAYFTAMTLARIADECPAAANRILAVSAVSGGSIGAAIYASAIHENPIEISDHSCNFSRSSKPGRIGTAVEEIFETDHLSPLLGRSLFPDLLAEALPLYIPQFDRQLGLEFSFENTFESVFKRATLSSPFSDLVDRT